MSHPSYLVWVDNTWTVTAEPEFEQAVASCDAIFSTHMCEKIQVAQAQKFKLQELHKSLYSGLQSSCNAV